MPSLNIKDYVLGGLVLIIIAMAIVIMINLMKIDELEEYKTETQLLAEKQREHIETLQLKVVDIKRNLDEEHNTHISNLNLTIDGLRKSSPRLMPSAPPSSADPTRACFGRDDIDRAIEEYRTEVQELVRTGSEAIISTNTCKTWISKVTPLYE